MENQQKESFIHKAFTYDLTKNRYVQVLVVLAIFILGVIFLVDYFSKESKCQREVTQKIKRAGTTVGIENDALIDSMIQEGIQRCAE